MGKKDDDTPTTGTAIPRPRLKRVERDLSMFAISQPTPTFSPDVEPAPPFDAEPPPPSHPTIEDVYRLIDRRLSPTIVQRLSSIPPPQPVHSMPVRALKHGGRWTKWAMAVLGVLTVVGEIWADVERYRGPISQLLVIAARQLDAHEAPELSPPDAEP